MEHTVNDTLEYVISLANHVRKGDISSAILVLLIEMGFQVHMEGFGYLRKALRLKCEDTDLRLADIYQEIARRSNPRISCGQIEQAIVAAIDVAWKNRDSSTWGYFFHGVRKDSKPSNKVFIARIACFLELWRDCC